MLQQGHVSEIYFQVHVLTRSYTFNENDVLARLYTFNGNDVGVHHNCTTKSGSKNILHTTAIATSIFVLLVYCTFTAIAFSLLS